MFKKENFFKNSFVNPRIYSKNLKKTKKIFKSLIGDLERNSIPILESYYKNYEFDFSKEIIKKFSKYENIIIIGMGGSILGTKSIYSFLKKKIKKKIFFFDNLDSDLYSKYKEIKNLKNSCFIVVSKSGNTIETVTNLGIIFSKDLLKNKLIVITEVKDNNLMALANKYNAEVIPHKEFLTGRYSVMSESSMFPARLMGLNTKKFKNLKKIIKNKNFVSSLTHSVACIYTLCKKDVNNSVILNYDSTLNDLGYWYQQLTAESLGKENKGINPILSFGPKDHHSLLQLYLDGVKDKFFTFFLLPCKEERIKISKNVLSEEVKFLKNKSLEKIVNAQSNAVKKIFDSKKIPYRQFIFSKRNEEELGMIFTFFVLETILLSSLFNVNPFDQPAVEQVKIQTERILS